MSGGRHGGCAAGRSSFRRAFSPTPRRARRCSRLRRCRRRLVERCRSTKPFLDVRGMERIAGTPTEIADSPAARRPRARWFAADRWNRKNEVLAKVASGVAKPAASSSSRREELEFLHRCRSNDFWGVGQVTPRSSTACGITTVRQVAELDETFLMTMLGRGTGRHSTRSHITATHAPSDGAGGADRSARSVRSAGAAGRWTSSTQSSSARRPASAPACERLRGWEGPSC